MNNCSCSYVVVEVLSLHVVFRVTRLRGPHCDWRCYRFEDDVIKKPPCG